MAMMARDSPAPGAPGVTRFSSKVTEIAGTYIPRLALGLAFDQAQLDLVFTVYIIV